MRPSEGVKNKTPEDYARTCLTAPYAVREVREQKASYLRFSLLIYIDPQGLWSGVEDETRGRDGVYRFQMRRNGMVMVT
jgi:hypothetical protein